jgi:ribulose-bisphosphate carboxylase small chain
MSAAIFSAPVAASGYVGLTAKPSKIFPAKDSIGWTKKTVSNGSRTYCMKVI